MARTHVRVTGGGNTYVKIGLNKTKKVEFLAQINDRPGSALANPVPIQPIGSPYPVEIATAYGQGAGTLTLQVWSTWEQDGWVSAFMSNDDDASVDVWDKFRSVRDSNSGNGYPVDLYEVLRAQRLNDTYIQVEKIEKNSKGEDYRVKSYQGCVITDIDASENVQNNSMDKQVTITMMYTHVITTYV